MSGGENKLSFAPFVAMACFLWIAATLTGSQGFTAIIGLLAIAAIFFKRPGIRLPAYGWALVASLVWISATTVWSPAAGPAFSGSVTGEDFSVDVASIRLIGTALFSALAIGAALAIPDDRAGKSKAAILVAALLLTATIFAVFVFKEEILALAYPGDPEEALRSGPQNIQRAANSVAVMLPVGLVGAWMLFPNMIVRAGLSIIIAALLAVFHKLGSQSAVMSALLMLAGLAIVWAWPQNGLRAMLRLIAGYVLVAPALFLGITHLVGLSGLTLPWSFQARIYGWRETSSKIFEQPLIGHGLEASGTWKDTYATRPEWLEHMTSLASPENADAMNAAWQNYPIVPGHPHNMALELWADTGVVGVLLVAATLWLASSRMPAVNALNKTAVFATAGLIGALLPLFSFAYSAWNEAFWGMLATAICAVIVLGKKGTA